MVEKGGNPARPLWAAEERSPEAGKTRRQVADAVRNLLNKYASRDIDASGTVWWKCNEAARFEFATHRWTTRRGWAGFSAEANVTLDDLNGAVNFEGSSPQ